MNAKVFGIFFLLVLTVPAVLQAEAPNTAPASVPASTAAEVKTYEELLSAIRGTRVESRARVEKAVEQERVREAWEIGRLIDAHVLQHKERADYGKGVLERLSTDLGMSRTELSYMLQFARAYPIFQPAEKLTWSHYEELLAVNDAKERQTLAERTEKEGWSRDRLREEVRNVTQGSKAAPAEVFIAKPGKPGTYRFVKATVGPETGKGVIDLGFSNYYKTSKDLRFEEGAIIEVMLAVPETGSSPSDLIRLSKRTPEDLYTYRAWVVNVLDGDTLKAVIDLGFGVRSVQTLRLRGIDAPEIATRDGMEAKKFVESALANFSDKPVIASPAGAKQSVLIKTVKSDKYDRYLADVWIDSRYLNQELIDEGLAVNVKE